MPAVYDWVRDVFSPVPVPPPPPPGVFQFCTGGDDYYLFWPCRKTITLKVPTGSSVASPAGTPSYSSWTVTDCKPRAVNKRELFAAGGGIVASDQVWLLPEAVRPAAAVPGPGTIVVDPEGTEWTVLEVLPRGRFGQTWRLVTRNLVAFWSLTQTAVVARPTTAKDTAGKAIPTWTTVYSNLRCRLQEQSGTAEPFADARATVRRFDLITATRVQLTVADRVTVGSTAYTVTGWTNPDRLGEPMVVQLERVA